MILAVVITGNSAYPIKSETGCHESQSFILSKGAPVISNLGGSDHVVTMNTDY